MENIRVQNLIESTVQAQQRKNGATAITFLTEEITTTELATGTSKMHGLVLWMPKDKLPANE